MSYSSTEWQNKITVWYRRISNEIKLCVRFRNSCCTFCI